MSTLPLPSRAQTRQSSEHVAALDGIRGLAILSVMWMHMTVLVPHTAFDTAYLQLASVGRVGVDLFFVLSGYLITGILFDAKGSTHYYRNFYGRRVLRIFPIYYAVVVLSLLVLPHIHHPKAANFARIDGDELWYWTFLQNYTIGSKGSRHGILDVTWSLAIEEQFYLVWPTVVALASRKRLLQLCIGLIVTAALVRCALFARHTNWFTIYCWTPCRMDGLAAGAFVALVARGRDGLAPLVRPARFAFIACGAAIVAMYAHDGFDDSTPHFLSHAMSYGLWAIFFASLLVFALTASHEGALSRVLRSRALTFFGAYSYGLYLVHLPLRAVVRDRLFPPQRFFTILGSQVPAQLVFYVLAIALAVSVAYASFHLFEKRFLRLKRYFATSATMNADMDAHASAVAGEARSG